MILNGFNFSFSFTIIIFEHCYSLLTSLTDMKYVCRRVQFDKPRYFHVYKCGRRLWYSVTCNSTKHCSTGINTTVFTHISKPTLILYFNLFQITYIHTCMKPEPTTWLQSVTWNEFLLIKPIFK